MDEVEVFEFPDDLPDPLHQAYTELVQKVESLPEFSMQAAAVKNLMSGLEAEEVSWCLDQLVRAALWGHQGAMLAMMATSWWLVMMRVEDDYERIKEIYLAAHQSKREAVVDLVRELPPHRALAKGRKLPEVRLPLDRDVTLGERRAMARGPQRRILERLLMDPSPLVIAKLLDNPQIRLPDVIVIASRRPTTPDLLMEVVLHRRWYGRNEAREAVLRNPFFDTSVTLKLLPTMGIKTLRDLAYSSDLHPLVHESARRLVRLREERTAPWRV